MKPPHLPKEICSIKQHQQLFRIKLLLVCVFFGLLAGGTGAIIVLGWIWPNTEVGSTWIVSQGKSVQEKIPLQNLIADEARDKIFTVYSAVVHPTRAVGSLEKKLGEAVSVSSDGWLAMYLADRNELNGVKSWSILSRDGVVFQVTDYQFDPYASLIYLKVDFLVEKGDKLTQFKVIGFYTDELAENNIFIFDDNIWQSDYLTGRQRALTLSARLDTAFNTAYVSQDSHTPGEPVINSRGWLVGFVTRDGLILPAQAVARILPQILSGQKIKYPSLGTTGWYSEEKPIIYAGERVAGYYVNRVWQTKSVLRPGDIILMVDGRPVVNGQSFFDLSGADKTLLIRRGEKEITVVTPLFYATEADYLQNIN